MDKQRLAEIKKLLEYTPDGPWDIDHYADDNDLVTDIWIDGEDCGHIEVYGDTAESSIYTAFFIKHARQDVPDLVAEVERLCKALETIIFDCESAKNSYIEESDIDYVLETAREALQNGEG